MHIRLTGMALSVYCVSVAVLLAFTAKCYASVTSIISSHQLEAMLGDFQIMKSKLAEMESHSRRLAVLEEALALQQYQLVAQRKQLANQKRQIVSLQRRLVSQTKAFDQVPDNGDLPSSGDTDNCGNKTEGVLSPRTIQRAIPKRGIRALAQVAFTAVLSYNQKNIGLSQTIKFDHVLLNDANGYSPHTGAFTAPATGVYLFAYHFGHGYAAGQVWLELMVNGVKQNGGVTDSMHTNQDLQGGNVAIIRLNVGDTVWIESFHQNGAALFGISGFTSWSGVLLY